MDLLYEWANDKLARENAFNCHKITYREHKNWFLNRIKLSINLMYICFEDNKPIGQVRIDINGNVGLIDYSIVEEERNKGYGTQILLNLADIIRENELEITKLVGRVKKNNIPSQKAFIKAGYNYVLKEGYIEYCRDI